MSVLRLPSFLILTGGGALAAATLPPEQAEFFEKRIRPVLASECYECHGGKKQKGGLRLDFRDGWKKGGESGDAIVPGQPEKSLLLKSIRHEDPDLKMPEKRPKLSDAAIADIEKWIALGAPDPRDEPPKAEAAVPWEQLLADRKTWWSLQPIRKGEPPSVKHSDWSAHPVDRFLLGKMEERGLAPAGDADPRTVIRRLTFALTGLPPTSEEVDAFVRECSEGSSSVIRHSALSSLADRLLASPRFGERWARHWMDLVRFAETHGSEGDPEIPEAWRYRDYLIRAFNSDVPLDQIIREHLAGDLLPAPRWNHGEQFNESILGIAHLRFVEHGFQPVDTRDEQVKVVDSQIDVAMKAFHGLTVTCARCHDHKFDAISQRDYTALAGIFESSRPAMITIDAPELREKNRAELLRLKGLIRGKLFDAWQSEAARIAARLLAEVEPSGQVAAAREKVGQLEKEMSAVDQAARDRLATQTGAREPALPVRPVARWTFDGDARDSLGGLHGELLGGALVQNGRLVLDGKGASFRSAPLARDLREKTLEAWVSLANLEQRGGGVITVENAPGAVFDSVVFAEKDPRQWMAGSDFFHRTRGVGGAPETAKPEELVHVAATYRPDGTIALFRNGQPCGQPWKPGADGPVMFAAGDARVLLGRRHTAGGKSFLAGEIEEARLYDRALEPAEVSASFRAGPRANAVGLEELLKALTPAERSRRETIARDLVAARESLRTASGGAEEKDWRAARAAAERNRANPFHLWAVLHGRNGDDLAGGWKEFQGSELQASNSPRTAIPGTRRQWNFAGAGGDYAACFHYGNGLDATPGPRGDFALTTSGDRVFGGLLPAGVATNRLSAMHNGVFATPRFRVDTDFISVKAWGGGGAQVRLIVDGYPLGTNSIFPRATFGKDEPAWIRLDTKYRKGSWACLEFATAPDLTRRDKKDQERSWFGVSEIFCHDADAPKDIDSPLAPLLAGAPPRTVQDLARRYADTVTEALAAWRDGRMQESQRLLLDFLIRQELLPASVSRIPSLKPLIEDYRRLEAEIPALRRAPGVLEADSYDAAFLPRGDHLKPGEPVPRAFLSVFGDRPFHTKQSGRLELASAITDPRNPLTPRVMVNRIWLHLFGRGIVATPDNFGRMGEKPTHPELLDYLAARFVEEDWSLTKAIRFLVTARAFALSSETPPAARERDAGNELLSHFQVRRLEAEAIRDSLLALSGRLDPAAFGPGAAINAPRRSLYLTIRRNALSPFLEVFDAPKPFTTIGRRDATNVPAQSLTLLNDPFVIECASRWADKLIAEKADPTSGDRIRRMFAAAFARPPTDAELAASQRYLDTIAASVPRESLLSTQAPWRDFAQSLFNLKEFIYLR
jgi:hypothetical protein